LCITGPAASLTIVCVRRRTDDQFLLAFLRSRKYKVEKAHECVVNFAHFWYSPKYRHIIEGLHAEQLRKWMATGMVQQLPGRDVHGNAVAAMYAGHIDPAALNFEDQVRVSIYNLAWVLENEDVQLHG